jgi:hypothetical protein
MTINNHAMMGNVCPAHEITQLCHDEMPIP